MMIRPVKRRMASITAISWKKAAIHNIGVKMPTNNPAITLEAPLLDLSGYATSSRNLIKGLQGIGTTPTIQPRWFKGAVSVKQAPDK